MTDRTPTAGDRHGSVDLPPDEYLAVITERYHQGNTPWDSGIPNPELVRVVEANGLPGKRVLELGCGTGTNAVELAKRGYDVTAADLVDLPVQQGREKAERAGVHVRFLVGDLTKIDLGGPYESIFDSGLYHGIRRRNLGGFLACLEHVTRPGARWLSIAGNSREESPDGPPTVSEPDIRQELGPLFRVIELREFRLRLGPTFEPLMWSVLMERR